MLIQVSLRRRSALIATVLMMMSGCGEQEAVPVVASKGVVRINGTPAANILVRFVPEGKQETGLISSSATSDTEGRFQLVASDGRDGAIPGPGHILLTDLEEERPAQGEVATKAPRLPPDYGVLGPASLTATVAEGAELAVDVKTR
jgi:hypothetical protein